MFPMKVYSTIRNPILCWAELCFQQQSPVPPPSETIKGTTRGHIEARTFKEEGGEPTSGNQWDFGSRRHRESQTSSGTWNVFLSAMSASEQAFLDHRADQKKKAIVCWTSDCVEDRKTTHQTTLMRRRAEQAWSEMVGNLFCAWLLERLRRPCWGCAPLKVQMECKKNQETKALQMLCSF